MFSSSQPIPSTEDRIFQGESLSSNTTISQRTPASVSSFFHEELTSVLGFPESRSFDSPNPTPLEPSNPFGQQANENDGQANIADATISEDIEETGGAPSYEEEIIGEPSSQDLRSWIWTQFSVIAMPGKLWTPKGSLKPRENREIRCAWPGCSFSTTDEKRQGSTSNLLRHLHVLHRVTKNDPSFAERHTRAIKDVKSLTHWMGKKPRAPTTLSTVEVLEHNLINWIITTTQPFTVIEDPAFQQIFQDLPGVFLPLTSARSVSRRIMDQFDTYRAELKEDLTTTCKTVAISLDVCTSETQIPILAIVGHWLTPEFDYREKVFDFKELEGI